MAANSSSQIARTSGQGDAERPRFVPPGRNTKLALSALIVVFFAGHLAMSWRSAALQDDRYGWRMFHNVAFFRIEYAWIKPDGTREAWKPTKRDVVRRGHNLIIPKSRNRWRPVWYSDGTIRTIIDTYVEHMGSESRRPEWAVGFEAIMELRINDDEDHQTLVYRYPEDAP